MTVTDLRLEAVVEILDRLASAVERVAPGDAAVCDAAVRAGRLRADSLAAVDRVQQEIETFSPLRRDWCEEHNRTLDGTDGLCPEGEARSKERRDGAREQAAGDDAVDPAVATDPPWLAGAIEHCLGGPVKPQPESEVMPPEPERRSSLDNASAPVTGADPPSFRDCIAAAHRAWLDTGASNEIINWHAIVRAVLATANAQPDRTTGSNNARGSAPPWIGVAVETFLACRPTEGSDRERLGRRLRAVLDWYNSRLPSEAEIEGAKAQLRFHARSNLDICAKAILIAAAKARSGT